MNGSQRLYRSETDKIIGGVCGGLAEYFQVDPVIIRLIFVLLGIFHGIGVITYIVMLIIVPKKSDIRNNPTNFSPEEEPEIVDAEIIDETEETETEKTFNDKKTEKTNSTPHAKTHNFEGKTALGIALVVIGGVILLERIFPVLTFRLLVPIVLIGLGLYFLFDNKGRIK